MFDKIFSRQDKKQVNTDIYAPGTGKVIQLSDIPDEVFSKELMGPTIAFSLHDQYVLSPADGILEVMFPTGHAFAVRMEDGTVILIHIGINTVNLAGKYFQVLCQQGKKVHAGDRIVKVDWDMVKKSGYNTDTMLIVTENPNNRAVSCDDSIVNAETVINHCV